ncbi:MAG: hypothetical protein COA78_27845 [Blastopirellula sp.]|nr:MAG: hypothetical protein COA78_27845 [Blastopirellula sp.]
MTDPIGWQLIENWRNGEISDEDFASLQELLRNDPQARQTLRRSMAMDSALRDRADAELLSTESDEGAVENYSTNFLALNLSHWYSSAALLIVGALSGCLFTGAAWAFASSRTFETFKLPVAVINGGFETDEAITESHYPQKPGVWSGDPVTIVESGDQEILPFDGNHMLRFDSTWSGQPESVHQSADLWQIVDLRPAKRTDTGSLMATLRVRVNRVDDGPMTDTMFRIKLFAFRGDPVSAETQFDNQEHLAHSDVKIDADADTATWETLSANVNLTDETDFLLIGMAARENVHNDPPNQQELAGHYVDGVELIVRSTE